MLKVYSFFLILSLFFSSQLYSEDDVGVPYFHAKMAKRYSTGFFKSAKEISLTFTKKTKDLREAYFVLDLKGICAANSSNVNCNKRMQINLRIMIAIQQGCGVIKYIAEFWSDEVEDATRIQNATISLRDYTNDYCFHPIKNGWKAEVEAGIGTNNYSTMELFGNPDKIAGAELTE